MLLKKTKLRELRLHSPHYSSLLRYTAQSDVSPISVALSITVRPGYAGDVHAVLEAFRLAKDRISVSKLTDLLRQLDYTYPYHQTIGFYLKHAGYPESDQLLAKRKPIMFDFYLSHNLKDPDFDPEWRVFFPRRPK